MDKKKTFLLRYTLMYALCLSITVGLGFVLVLVSLESPLLKHIGAVVGVIVAASLAGGFWLAWLIRRRTLRKISEKDEKAK